MSQTISIPASFEFRPRPMHWEIAKASVVGWMKRDDGNDDTDHLACSAATPSGTIHAITVPLQALDFELWNRIAGSSHYLESEEVAEMCEGYVLNGLLATPDTSREAHLADAWEMRRHFLEMRPELDHQLAFLRKWGAWGSDSLLREPQLLREQREYRESLMAGAEAWFSNKRFSFGLIQAQKKFPHALLASTSCREALKLTITLDFLRGIRFGVCSRPDCGKVFPMETRREKKYCCWDCGHLVAVRESRKRPKGH